MIVAGTHPGIGLGCEAATAFIKSTGLDISMVASKRNRLYVRMVRIASTYLLTRGILD